MLLQNEKENKSKIYKLGEEKIIGVWKDGRPIYEKTIEVEIEHTASITSSTVPFSLSKLGLTNISDIWINLSSSYMLEGDSRYGWGGAYVNEGVLFFANRVHVSPSEIVFNIFFNGPMSIAGVVTLRYTKTTDLPI